MKKSLILIAGLLIFTGCKEKVSGRLDVAQDLQLNRKKDTVTIKEGSYSATLGFKTKKKLTLNLKADGDAGKTFTINLPKGMVVSNRNGDFTLTPAQSGQPYTIDAHVDTVTTTSDLYDGVESCYETITRRRCSVDRQTGERVCHTDSTTVEGRRYYTYFYETDDKVFELSLLNDDGAKAAYFDGSKRDTRTVRLHSTGCIIKYRDYRYAYRHCRAYGRYGRHRCL
ncbi:MAG: hypothetical protein EP319_10385 [Deltaproteobacteria bacterium]|nr:MAG: hypothetical protein EP319_10385 [Deltaproteobacteria bacterium]